MKRIAAKGGLRLREIKLWKHAEHGHPAFYRKFKKMWGAAKSSDYMIVKQLFGKDIKLNIPEENEIATLEWMDAK